MLHKEVVGDYVFGAEGDKDYAAEDKGKTRFDKIDFLTTFPADKRHNESYKSDNRACNYLLCKGMSHSKANTCKECVNTGSNTKKKKNFKARYIESLSLNRETPAFHYHF